MKGKLGFACYSDLPSRAPCAPRSNTILQGSVRWPKIGQRQNPAYIEASIGFLHQPLKRVQSPFGIHLYPIEYTLETQDVPKFQARPKANSQAGPKANAKANLKASFAAGP
jgi:hypothetical protein